MSGLDYFASERFIHDDLLQEVERGIPSIRESWRTRGKIEPFAITWLEGPVKGDDGSNINSRVLVELEDEPDHLRALRKAVVRTKAYALLLVEQKEDRVLLLFESQHGSQSWSFPIEKHGSDRVLGPVSTEADKEHVGLLWKPSPRR